MSLRILLSLLLLIFTIYHLKRYGEKARINTELFNNLAWKTKGFFQFLELPQAAPLMRQALSTLLESHCIFFLKKKLLLLFIIYIICYY